MGLPGYKNDVTLRGTSRRPKKKKKKASRGGSPFTRTMGIPGTKVKPSAHEFNNVPSVGPGPDSKQALLQRAT